MKPVEQSSFKMMSLDVPCFNRDSLQSEQTLEKRGKEWIGIE